MKPSAMLIAGRAIEVPAPLRWWNYQRSGIHQFGGELRGVISELVVHESVTVSWQATIKILRLRNLGVDMTLGVDGVIRQHADFERNTQDAGPHNPRSVGVELTNPFYPHNLQYAKAGTWPTVIEDAPWADGGAYVVPRPAQLEALVQLIQFLTSPGLHPKLQIPLQWAGYDQGMVALGRVPGGKRQHPGLWAHTYYGHSDGAFPLLYTWLRIVGKLAPAQALGEAVRLATGAENWVQVAAYLNPGEAGATPE